MMDSGVFHDSLSTLNKLGFNMPDAGRGLSLSVGLVGLVIDAALHIITLML